MLRFRFCRHRFFSAPPAIRAVAGLLLLAGLPMACQQQPAREPTVTRRADSLRLFRLIEIGDSVYARKQGYDSFAASLVWYDSAQLIADRWQDTLMQAEVVFAKGRVYDAWNKNQPQTVRYFSQAAQLYRTLPAKQRRYFYTKHLVAHAYDKMQDSSGAVRVLGELLTELSDKDTARLHEYGFVTEMALIATEVGAYDLADRILIRLTRRAWIRNNPESYDYLYHYYLTRSRIDVLARHRPDSPYLDSLQLAFRQSHNLMDTLYYATNLVRLYTAGNRPRQAHSYEAYERQAHRQLNGEEAIAQMQQRLVDSELLAEKTKLAQQYALRRIQLILLWGLGGLLLVITALAVLLYRRNRIYREQSQKLLAVNEQLDRKNEQLDRKNEQLDRKVEQVELLHKETQHRVKNSLNMVYSLLQMQERRSADQPAAVAMLQQARLRVESIAHLQQELGSPDEAVNLTDFCTHLIGSVVACFSTEHPVVTRLAIAPVRLPAGQYLPLSLILTEWVINSLKYAAPVGPDLHISVSLEPHGSECRLTYSDSGRPPAIGQSAGSGGLGQQIVGLLCRQLNGRLTTAADYPYHYQLVFGYGG